MSGLRRVLTVGLLCGLAVAGCGSSDRPGPGGGQAALRAGWARYSSPLGWSIAYPKALYFKSTGPATPDYPAPPGGPYTTVTMANFPWLARGGPGTYGVPVDSSHRFPSDGVVIRIQGGVWGELLQVPDAQFPLSFSEFRRGAWSLGRLPEGAPWPLEHTIDAAGQRYFVQVWLGHRAPSRIRAAVSRIIASLRFRTPQPGTLHGAVAVVGAQGRYPVGSFTLLHIKGVACSGRGETCHSGREPIYLVHAPGRFQYVAHPLPDERCTPASSCVPFGSFYAISWKDKTGYPSACQMRLDLRQKQFYCANMPARWDAGGRPLALPNPHDYPTALSFDVAKIAFNGHVIIGGAFTAEIPESVVRLLWPDLPLSG